VTVPAAVVFDFDGVLADTEALQLRAFQAAFAPRGWTLDRAAYFERYLGLGEDRDLVETFAVDSSITLTPGDADEVTRAKARAYADLLAGGSVLFAGAADAVRRLGAHFRLGIASGSMRREIEAILSGTDLIPAFRIVVAADDVVRSKPAPDLYLAAIAALRVPAARAVAIEDSRWGLASARAAGLHTIGITTSYPAAALSSADVVVSSLDEISVELVRGLLDPAG
jgi:beta-phosphoglucomutase